MTKIQYDIAIIEEAFNNLYNFHLLDIDPTTIYNFTNREKTTINKVLGLYNNTKLYKDAEVTQLEHYEEKEVTEMSNCFLTELFPNYKSDILGFDNLLEFNDIPIGEQGLIYSLRREKTEFHRIELSNNYNGYLISTIAHEKVHALTFKYMDTTELYKIGLELLPVFIQNILLYKLEKQLSPNIAIYGSIIRTIEGKQSYEFLKIINTNENNPNRTELDKQVMTYLKIKVYRYLTAEIYSNLLLKHYIENRNKMIDNINRVIDGKITLTQFLAIYDISFNNNQIIPTLKENLNKVKRKIIIP